MKKLLLSLMLIAFAATLATAQEKKTTTTVKDEKTTKKTSTIPQKVHNTFSKDKHYNGKKTKHTKVVEKKTTEEKK